LNLPLHHRHLQNVVEVVVALQIVVQEEEKIDTIGDVVGETVTDAIVVQSQEEHSVIVITVSTRL
jgi:hypothetical protein